MTNPSLSTLPVAVIAVLGVVVVAQVILAIIALRDLYKRPVAQVVFTNKWIWLAIILLANLLGPILYLVAGRKPAVLTEHALPPASIHTENIADVLYGPRDDKNQ